jgi:hypothetical protein
MGLLAGSLALTACGDEPAGSPTTAAASGGAPGYDTGSPATAAAPENAASATAAGSAGAASAVAVAQGGTDPAASRSTPSGAAATGAGTTAVSGGGTPIPAAGATNKTDAGAASTTAGGNAAGSGKASPGAATAGTGATGGSAAGTGVAASAAGAGGAGGSALYKVVDGNKVDPGTMKGFRAWRSAACDRCHGPNQEGMVGPSLIQSLKTLTKEQFVTTVAEGRLDKGMPAFKTNSQVMENMDHLYAYLKGRSDGAITSAKVQEIE